MIRPLRSLQYAALIALIVCGTIQAYNFATKLAVVRSVSGASITTGVLVWRTLDLNYSVAQPHQSVIVMALDKLFGLPSVQACGTITCDGTENKPVDGGTCADDPPGNPCVPWECKDTGNMHKACTGPYYNSPTCLSCRFDHNQTCKAPPP
jgi:hypothetical protein